MTSNPHPDCPRAAEANRQGDDGLGHGRPAEVRLAVAFQVSELSNVSRVGWADIDEGLAGQAVPDEESCDAEDGAGQRGDRCAGEDSGPVLRLRRLRDRVKVHPVDVMLPISEGQGAMASMAGRLAMVTGASSGIGEAFARDLARRGFSLILVARRRDRLEALASEVGTSVSADILVADLGSDDGVATVARRLELGGVSLFVNNAGLGYRGLISDQEPGNVRQLSRVNFEAPMLLSRAALGPMIRRGQGEIVNVVSMGAFQPVPYLGVYAATKAGLLSFTEALADEVAGTGVRVQALCPGNIPTGFQEVAGTKGSRFDRTPAMSAADVARSSLDAILGGGPTLHLPAVTDRLSVFGQRFIPRAVARRVAGHLMKPE